MVGIGEEILAYRRRRKARRIVNEIKRKGDISSQEIHLVLLGSYALISNYIDKQKSLEEKLKKSKEKSSIVKKTREDIKRWKGTIDHHSRDLYSVLVHLEHLGVDWDEIRRVLKLADTLKKDPKLFLEVTKHLSAPRILSEYWKEQKEIPDEEKERFLETLKRVLKESPDMEDELRTAFVWAATGLPAIGGGVGAGGIILGGVGAGRPLYIGPDEEAQLRKRRLNKLLEKIQELLKIALERHKREK